jgi:VanZ family protein
MEKYSAKYILPLILWMAVIFVSSSVPQDVFPKVNSWIWAKLVHVVYFGVLALLVQRTLLGQEKYHLLLRYVQLISILFAVFYGASDEIHQLFTPGRHAQVTDVLIDGFGASLFILGSVVYRALVPKFARTDSK